MGDIVKEWYVVFKNVGEFVVEIVVYLDNLVRCDFKGVVNIVLFDLSYLVLI